MEKEQDGRTAKDLATEYPLTLRELEKFVSYILS